MCIDCGQEKGTWLCRHCHTSNSLRAKKCKKCGRRDSSDDEHREPRRFSKYRTCKYSSSRSKTTLVYRYDSIASSRKYQRCHSPWTSGPSRFGGGVGFWSTPGAELLKSSGMPVTNLAVQGNDQTWMPFEKSLLPNEAAAEGEPKGLLDVTQSINKSPSLTLEDTIVENLRSLTFKSRDLKGDSDSSSNNGLVTNDSKFSGPIAYKEMIETVIGLLWEQWSTRQHPEHAGGERRNVADSGLNGQSSKEKATSDPKGKRKARIGADEQSDEDQDGDQSPPKPCKRQQTLPVRTWACPFFKKDPDGYYDCHRSVLTKVSRVKQHIDRKHRTELSQEIQSRLKDRLPSALLPEDQWYSVFVLIFPGTPRPSSPYMPPITFDESVGSRLERIDGMPVAFHQYLSENNYEHVFQACQRVPLFATWDPDSLRKVARDIVENLSEVPFSTSGFSAKNQYQGASGTEDNAAHVNTGRSVTGIHPAGDTFCDPLASEFPIRFPEHHISTFMVHSRNLPAESDASTHACIPPPFPKSIPSLDGDPALPTLQNEIDSTVWLQSCDNLDVFEPRFQDSGEATEGDNGLFTTIMADLQADDGGIDSWNSTYWSRVLSSN